MSWPRDIKEALRGKRVSYWRSLLALPVIIAVMRAGYYGTVVGK